MILIQNIDTFSYGKISCTIKEEPMTWPSTGLWPVRIVVKENFVGILEGILLESTGFKIRNIESGEGLPYKQILYPEESCELEISSME